MKLVFRLVEPGGCFRRLIWSSKPNVGGGYNGRVEVKAGGTIAIPGSLLRQIGIRPGARVLVYSDGEDLVIERLDRATGICEDTLTETSPPEPPPLEG